MRVSSTICVVTITTGSRLPLLLGGSAKSWYPGGERGDDFRLHAQTQRPMASKRGQEPDA